MSTATGNPGIATGIVVVGDLIGSGSAQERAIVGETPNLAARLQAGAAPPDKNYLFDELITQIHRQPLRW